ncbi:DDE-type integrase/transposase/recombinase [Buchananella hordeovulneris]|uniref:DDE-type integrase/transposase/recombinase n=1 Tax=Buchananella hordeovulneris TaxID=52770 RepID=UPI0026DAD4D5|nr:DDE-type integrase/transposase/recombinase [Buchananella hordeovulneris]MDO5080732.1 DDE-type integrase/transposase/recombinase [Buchananella hordeovulneris]
MRLAGLKGVVRGHKAVTTRSAPGTDTRPDLVERHFARSAPNQLWVADITYVRTRSGFVYTAFVTDAFSRKIAGWAVSNTLNAQALPLQALEQAIATAKGSVEGLVHHSDHGSQYVCVAYHERLVEAGIDASTTTEGEYLRQRTGQTRNGLCASELT